MEYRCFSLMNETKIEKFESGTDYISTTVPKDWCNAKRENSWIQSTQSTTLIKGSRPRNILGPTFNYVNNLKCLGPTKTMSMHPAIMRSDS